MPQYEPPPASLEHLNAIQRYMQKGSLDREDYIWLVLIVLAYFATRPYLDAGLKRLFKHKDLSDGEETQKEYLQSKAKAKIGANTIRGSTNEVDSPVAISQTNASASGSDVKKTNGAVNRKTKTESPDDLQKTLLEWDDEPPRKAVEGDDGDKADVVTWLDRWDK